MAPGNPNLQGTATAGPRPWRRALIWLVFLGPFFYVTYGYANWLADRHTDVGAIVFDWERHVPFVDWTIVPYWSINAFYALSLFVCATRRVLDAHAKRLLTAQVIAVTCFVLWPLRFTYEQPETSGLYGALFDLLGAFDKPYNQAPSLHIALLVVLWCLYTRYVAAHWAWLLHLWFFLIGVTVLTTYQHHFIDIPTGALLGWLCAWQWPLERPAALAASSLSADPQRRKLATRYATGAVILVLVSASFRGEFLWLLWPAVSLLLVAAVYLFLGPGGFQKSSTGQMSAAARWLLAPYIAGAWINSRCWTRGETPAVEVADGIWLGRFPNRATLRAYSISTIVDLSAELPAPRTDSHWIALPTLDLVTPSAQTLREAARLIEQARQDGPVLVCCALGYSRSASAVAAWLLSTGRAASLEAAVDQIRAARSSIVLNGEAGLAIEAATR